MTSGKPIGTGAVATSLVEVGSRIGLGTACPLIEPSRVRVSRKGATSVRARWSSCAGLAGRVRLKLRILDGCTRLVGRVRAKGYRQRVQGTRSECGDGILDATLPAVPFEPTRTSLAAHGLPRWFADAKFGIMIHWGIFTIPAWAETVIDPGEWLSGTKLLEPPDFGRPFFTHIPYTEWYPNTILIDGSPAQQHHRATYGADFAYEDFRPQFEQEAAAWSGDAWAELFRESGARYVVLVTKHHDGFALWPTSVPHPRRAGWHMPRDIVGELSTAVRARCMRMGLYYSGGLDWSVQPGPIATSLDILTVAPRSPEYIAYANGQWRELIERYRPSILWNDIGYPTEVDALTLFADYYNAIPGGVVNDRFSVLPGGTHHDYLTPEYSVLSDISTRKFETVRGMGRGFAYNRNEGDNLDSAESLIHLLADVVSKNGNLLLNVGPLADGTIPAAQAERLRAIGRWLAVNGEAVFDTRPWTRAAGTTGGGTPVRFTASGDGATVYAIVLGPLPADVVTLRAVGTPSTVRLLGARDQLTWSAIGDDLRIDLSEAPAPQPAYVFALGQ